MSAVSPEAAVTIERRVEWHDTDAAGHQHYSAILRWVEDAEAELLRRYGIDWLFGTTPRVRHEVNYSARLWFGDLTRTRIRIADLGRSSMRFEFDVRGPSGVAAEGVMVVVHARPEERGAVEWPPEVVAALGVSTNGVAPEVRS